MKAKEWTPEELALFEEGWSDRKIADMTGRSKTAVWEKRRRMETEKWEREETGEDGEEWPEGSWEACRERLKRRLGIAGKT